MIDFEAREPRQLLRAEVKGSSFGEVLAEEFVDVFNGTLFPAGVSMSIIELGVERVFNEFGVEELGTTVSGDGVYFEPFE